MAININDRRIIDGPNDRLMQISPVRYPWARDIWDTMLKNTWFPKEVILGNDVQCYRSQLTDSERRMYDKALAFLSNLDGIQLNNLVFNIGKYITDPVVSMCVVRQAFEEAIHVDSYATLIEAIGRNPIEIYNTFDTDEVLAAKNQYIMRQSEILGNDYSPRNFAMAVVANLLLEGLFFYDGFLSFYALARSGKMLGSAKMIRLIQRDEGGTHLELFANIGKTLRLERPEIFDAQFRKDAVELIKAGTELEITWGQHIISGGVLGLTNDIMRGFAQERANICAELAELPLPYPGNKNPVPWFDKFSQVDNVDANFFEDKIDSYQVGGVLDWHDF